MNKKISEKDSVSKSWFTVFNNPEKHGYDGEPQDIVEKILDTWISIVDNGIMQQIM